MITSLPSLVKGSGKQSSFSNQWRVRPSYAEYRAKESSVSNENFKFKIPKHAYVNCTERSGIVCCYEIHPQLKAGRSSSRICRHASYLFDLQEQFIKPQCEEEPSFYSPPLSSPPLARFGKVVATHAYELTFLQLMMLEQKMLYTWIYVYVKFSKRECQQWRMVLWEWCKLWDDNAFVLKHVLEHVSRRRGRGTPLCGLYRSGVCCWTQGLEY